MPNSLLEIKDRIAQTIAAQVGNPEHGNGFD